MDKSQEMRVVEPSKPTDSPDQERHTPTRPPSIDEEAEKVEQMSYRVSRRGKYFVR